MVELMAAGASVALAGLALAAGWQAGRRWGREEGKARALLELQRHALTGSRCPACGRPIEGGLRPADPGVGHRPGRTAMGKGRSDSRTERSRR